jgi:hypothetical protein
MGAKNLTKIDEIMYAICGQPIGHLPKTRGTECLKSGGNVDTAKNNLKGPTRLFAMNEKGVRIGDMNLGSSSGQRR